MIERIYEKGLVNQPMVKTASGLLIDHNTAGIGDIKMKKPNEKNVVNEIYEKHKEKYDTSLSAPIPKIKLPYNFVLTRATPPRMIDKTEGGILVNKLDVDERTMQRLLIMTEHVSDVQEVMMTGFNVDERVCVAGEHVRIDFRRFRTLNDDHTAGVIETSYEVPVHTIDGYDYLIIDSRDIIYAK